MRPVLRNDGKNRVTGKTSRFVSYGTHVTVFSAVFSGLEALDALVIAMAAAKRTTVR